MELRTLGYFVAVAEEGSVSAAADVVHVTQPAISRQLQQLEAELGVELFVRSAGRLRLSAAGAAFLPHARDVLGRASTARAAARSFAAGRLENVTISAPTTTLTDVIAPFLATFGADDPMPTVLEADPSQAFEYLARGADLALTTVAPGPEFASMPVAVLPVWAYVPDGHEWAGQASVSLEALAKATVLALPPSFKPRIILADALQAAGLVASDLTECNHPQVAQALAAAGRGVAVVSDDPRFGLHALRIVGPDGPLTLDLFAAWEPRHHAASALAGLAERLGRFCVERYGVEVAASR
jgi:DNA-binding transcriptional LysR family regulator